jgi:alpha-tubulin suppressor-like RCC1 family protein
VTQAGGVKCWGRNHQGQLGTGDTTPSGVPVDVPNLPAAALSVAAGDAHTCMLSTAGDVYCWGDNEFGQLGDGTGVDSLVPVAVSGLTDDVVALSASKDHTCALSAQGGVSCWGYGTDGQLGDNTTAHRSTPVTPRGLDADCVSVGVGWAHSCATCIDARGFSGTYCWGSDAYGQLGNNFDGDRTTPQRTANAGDHPESLCGGGRHTCGVTRGGGIDCVGSDADGQLGYPGASTDTWKDVTGYPAGGVQVACGSFWTMALDDAGGVKFWGNELDGIDKIREPRDVPGLSFNVSAIDAGWNHACVVRTNGEVLCWGVNTYGQVGVGSSESTIADPTLVNL